MPLQIPKQQFSSRRYLDRQTSIETSVSLCIPSASNSHPDGHDTVPRSHLVVSYSFGHRHPLFLWERGHILVTRANLTPQKQPVCAVLRCIPDGAIVFTTTSGSVFQSAVVLPVATSNSSTLGINIAAVVKPNVPQSTAKTNMYLPSNIDVIM